MSNLLVYDDLVREYYENLHTTLRGFRPGPDYLESWVHDENHHRSIVGLFEAAEEKGIEELHLRVGVELAHTLDRRWLAENLEEFGTLTFFPLGEGLELRLKYAKARDLSTVHPAYRKGLEAASRALIWEGTVKAEDPTELVLTAETQNVTLSLLLDQGGRIKEARHLGARGATLPLLDRLCEWIRDLPLQEAAEHGTIHLEKNLRDPDVAPPVPGLIMPENADPVFQLPAALLRKAYETFLAQSGNERGPNDFARPVRAAWAALSAPEQMARVAEAWRAICSERGLPYAGMEVIAIKGATRVVFAAPVPPAGKSFGHDLLLLERELKRRLEPELEITLESVEDRNQRESRTRRDPETKP